MGKETRESSVRRRRARGAGFTLIEMLVSFSALLIVLLGFSRMLLSSQMASRTTHEATLAKEAARAQLEELHGANFAEVYARFNSDPNDDPGGDSPGAGFAIRGLEAPVGDADGLPGVILFPEINGELREDVLQPQLFGTALDLNGDGNALGPDNLDHSNDYRILPVVVRVEWRSSAGDGRVEFRSVIGSF